jgi:hypothetical protein
LQYQNSPQPCLNASKATLSSTLTRDAVIYREECEISDNGALCLAQLDRQLKQRIWPISAVDETSSHMRQPAVRIISEYHF